MFHVLDHTDLVYSGDLSQATQYVLEHSGKRLDEAIRSGIRILYSDALHSLQLGRCLPIPLRAAEAFTGRRARRIR